MHSATFAAKFCTTRFVMLWHSGFTSATAATTGGTRSWISSCVPW